MCFPLQECQIQKFKGEIENMEEKNADNNVSITPKF